MKTKFVVLAAKETSPRPLAKQAFEQQYKLDNEGVINYAGRSKNYEIG
jgi:hypothetical protein